jgi:hypothetical protein
MWVVAKGLAGLVMLLHVYIVLIETVLFRVRGKKVFGMTDERAEIMAPAMSNQGCYNGFLVAALALGFVLPNPGVRGGGGHLGSGDGEAVDPLLPDDPCGGGAGRALPSPGKVIRGAQSLRPEAPSGEWLIAGTHSSSTRV